jgi:CDP-glucose 4,6-dehydratase
MYNSFNNIYNGKKVLVTGHTGFKGTWLSLWLKELGAEVLGYALPPVAERNHYDLLKLDMNSCMGDVRDREGLARAFTEYRPEIVFHLAAQPLVRESYRDPCGTIETNVIGTINLFEAVRKTSSVKAVVNVTSDKCYDNHEWVWGYRENDPMGGFDPYSASKGCVELLTSSYRNSFFNLDDFGKKHSVLLASTRAGNVIGGGDWAEDRLMPDIMRAVLSHEVVSIRYPQATRPWQYVLDPLSGYLLLGQKLLEGKKDFAQAWNFGPTDDGALSVGDLVKHVKTCWDQVDYRIVQSQEFQHEAHYLKLDCSKAHIKLAWSSLWDIKMAIKQTVDWYRHLYDQKELRSRENLRQYIEDAVIQKKVWA